MSNHTKDKIKVWSVILGIAVIVNIPFLMYLNHVNRQVDEAQQEARVFADTHQTLEVVRSDDMTDPRLVGSDPVCTLVLSSVEKRRFVLIYRSQTNVDSYKRCLSVVPGDVVSLSAMARDRDQYRDFIQYLHYTVVGGASETYQEVGS